MRVAVAGADSVVGRCAVPGLEAAGHEVVRLGRGGRLAPRRRHHERRDARLRRPGEPLRPDPGRAVGPLATRLAHARPAALRGRPHGWCSPPGPPGCAGSCTRASRSSTPTRAGLGDRGVPGLRDLGDRAGVGRRARRPGLRLDLPRRAWCCGWGCASATRPCPAGRCAPPRSGRPVGLGLAGRLRPRDPQRRRRRRGRRGADRAVRRLQRRRRAGPAGRPGRRATPRRPARTAASFVGPLMTRLGGHRLEPLGRSLRVSSDRFSGATGWVPRRARFDAVWLDAARARRRRRAGEPWLRTRTRRRDRPTRSAAGCASRSSVTCCPTPPATSGTRRRRAGAAGNDEWLRSNVPPHHG